MINYTDYHKYSTHIHVYVYIHICVAAHCYEIAIFQQTFHEVYPEDRKHSVGMVHNTLIPS